MPAPSETGRQAGAVKGAAEAGLVPSAADELLDACRAASERGEDFPTIWQTILKSHPMVAGSPVQRLDGPDARLEIQLLSGERLLVGPGPHDYVLASEGR